MCVCVCVCVCLAGEYEHSYAHSENADIPFHVRTTTTRKRRQNAVSCFWVRLPMVHLHCNSIASFESDIERTKRLATVQVAGNPVKIIDGASMPMNNRRIQRGTVGCGPYQYVQVYLQSLINRFQNIVRVQSSSQRTKNTKRSFRRLQEK